MSQSVTCPSSDAVQPVQNAVQLIVAPTSTFTTLGTALDSVQGAIDISLEGNTGVELYIATGDTSLVGAAQMDVGKALGLQTLRAKEIKKGFAAISNQATCLLSNQTLTPELDLLRALNMAADNARESKTKDIYVVSNGLQSTGDLKLQDSFGSENSVIVSSLKAKNAIPNLNGFTVHFVGLGQFSGDQPKFGTLSLKKLQDLWLGLVAAGGGKGEIDGSISLGKGNSDGVLVSLVSPIFVPPVVQNCRAILTDENLTFIADSAEFLKPADAEQTFGALKQQFDAQNCQGKIVVKGYTTNAGSDESQSSIATARSLAVKKRLETIFPGAKIESIGVGYDGTGGLDASNRRVEINYEKAN